MVPCLHEVLDHLVVPTHSNNSNNYYSCHYVTVKQKHVSIAAVQIFKKFYLLLVLGLHVDQLVLFVLSVPCYLVILEYQLVLVHQ